MNGEAVGLIGLGLMGAALAARLQAAGFTVVGYDIDPQKTGAGSAREVADRCKRILLSVLTTAQVEEAIAAMGDALMSGALIIDTTTGEPERRAALGTELAARGVGYVDATIGGSSADLARGAAVWMIGGADGDVARCDDLFDALGARRWHLGPCGAGARAKLVFNLAVGLHRAVLGEALGLAAALDLDPERMLDVLQGGVAASAAMATKGKKMLTRDFTPQARLDQHLKDVEIILAEAARRGATVPLTTVHADLLRDRVAAGYGPADNSAIVTAFLPEN